MTKNPQFLKALKTGKMKYYDLPTKTFGDIELPTGAYSPNVRRKFLIIVNFDEFIVLI